MTALDKLTEKLMKSVSIGDCWEWEGHTDALGYGKTPWGGKSGGRVHRIVWEVLIGPIPKGLQIDHLCRNPPCCNPDHLEPVTRSENIRRGIAGKHNAGKTHCPHGHPYAGDNLHVRSNGMRHCRACNRDRTRRYRAAKRAS